VRRDGHLRSPDADLERYWIADAVNPGLRLLALRDGQWIDVAPDAGGRLHSTVCPRLILHPVKLLANLDG